RRYVEIAGEVNRQGTMKHATDGLGVSSIPSSFGSNAPQGLMHSVAVSESVVCGFPVGVLVRRAKSGHAQGCCVGKRPREINGQRSRTDCPFQSIDYRLRIIGKERMRETVVIAP